MLSLLLAAAAPAAAVPAPPVPDRAAIEAIVRDYILTHPEILPEAMNRLQAREIASAIAANRAAIFTPYASAWEGAAEPDITIVQFFDYACQFCRKSLPDIDRLLREDRKLRIVYREFPVLGEESEAAALAGLAAARAGNYRTAHRALYAAPSLDARGIAKAAGIAAAPDPAARAEIERNRGLARPLGLTGTPSWVIGNRVLSGAVGYDTIRTAIAEARASVPRG